MSPPEPAPVKSNPMQIYDISQTIARGIGVWPGDRRFRSEWTLRMTDGDPCNVSSVTMSVHTGTHADAPYHFDPSGADIAGVSLDRFIGPARVIEYLDPEPLSAAKLEHLPLDAVERVLFKTRASLVPSNRFERDFVSLTEDAAEYLGRRNLRLVGTDAPSVDDFSARSMPAHKVLLRYEVAILEGLRLSEVPPGDYELIALPLRFAGLDGSPVRAILRK
jgi:arylformamidase